MVPDIPSGRKDKDQEEKKCDSGFSSGDICSFSL